MPRLWTVLVVFGAAALSVSGIERLHSRRQLGQRRRSDQDIGRTVGWRRMGSAVDAQPAWSRHQRTDRRLVPRIVSLHRGGRRGDQLRPRPFVHPGRALGRVEVESPSHLQPFRRADQYPRGRRLRDGHHLRRRRRLLERKRQRHARRGLFGLIPSHRTWGATKPGESAGHTSTLRSAWAVTGS